MRIAALTLMLALSAPIAASANGFSPWPVGIAPRPVVTGLTAEGLGASRGPEGFRLRRGAVARTMADSRPEPRPDDVAIRAIASGGDAEAVIGAAGAGTDAPGGEIAWRAGFGAGPAPVTAAPLSWGSGSDVTVAGPGSFLTLASSAKARREAPAGSGLRAVVSLGEQRMRVYDGDLMIHDWPVSTGRKGFASSRGSFTSQWLSRNHRSRKYDGAPMPCAIFYNGGEAIHATSDTGKLGRPASHGCVRLAKPNACRLFDAVRARGERSLSVTVR